MLPMREALVAYFAGEKQGGLAALVMGLVALALAAGVWTTLREYRGAAWPLGVVGVIELGLGLWLLFASDPRSRALVTQLEEDAPAYHAGEVTRLERVRLSFQAVKVVELLAFATGVALTYVFSRREFVFAIGVGLIAQSAALLVFDLFAERRADHYLAALHGFRPPPPEGP